MCARCGHAELMHYHRADGRADRRGKFGAYPGPCTVKGCRCAGHKIRGYPKANAKSDAAFARYMAAGGAKTLRSEPKAKPKAARDAWHIVGGNGSRKVKQGRAPAGGTTYWGSTGRAEAKKTTARAAPKPSTQPTRTTRKRRSAGRQRAALVLGTVGLDVVSGLWATCQLAHAAVSKKKSSKEVRRKALKAGALAIPAAALFVFAGPVVGGIAAVGGYTASVAVRSNKRMQTRRLQQMRRKKGPVRSAHRARRNVRQKAVKVRTHINNGRRVLTHTRSRPSA